jgi:hypothetical protein
MSNKINIWNIENDFFATLKTGKDLFKDIDTITLQLVESVLEELKSMSYDELMDWLDGSTTEELVMFMDYFIDDHRLFEVTKIEISRR